MSRLTTRDKDGFATVTSITKHIKVLEKLAYYEDLEEQLEKVYGEHNGLLETAVKSLVRHEGAEFNKPCKARLLTDEDVDKWETYKSLEEQGLLLKPPCRAGDTVWCIFEGKVYEAIARKVTIVTGSNNYQLVKIEAEFDIVDIFYNDGRLRKYGVYQNYLETVFLTKSEAEKALAEMEK
jgi:hypothetical protein